MRDFAVSVPSMRGTTVLYRQKVSKRMPKSVKEKTARTSLLLPGLFFLLIVSILCYVWTRVQAVQYGYEISSALRAKEAAVLDNNERTIEIATLRSAQQVEKRVRAELGMNPPRKNQLVIIR
jgi:cell division protein FtsL